MSSKNKKSKHHKSKKSDDISDNDKKIFDENENDSDNDNDIKESPRKKKSHENENDNDNHNDNDIKEGHHKKSHRKRKRYHTKVSHNKENNLSNLLLEAKNEKGKKVKFTKIDVIDVESWKKLNLKMTAEENLDELLKLTEGRKERKKNVNCCIII